MLGGNSISWQSIQRYLKYTFLNILYFSYNFDTGSTELQNVWRISQFAEFH